MMECAIFDPLHDVTGCNVDNFFVFLRLLFFALFLLYVT